MSATQVAVLEPLRARERDRGPARHPAWTTLGAFAGLAGFGAVRWGSMLSPAPTAKLLSLAALATGSAATLTLLRGRWSRLGIALAAVAGLAVLPISGIPLAWLIHLRLAVIVRFVGHGLGRLPGTLVPVLGRGQVPTVVVLGGGLLLWVAAIVVGFGARREPDARWRVAGATVLLALMAIPATIISPRLPYLEGLLAFALVAALVWGERLGSGPGLLLVVTAAGGALLLGPAIRPAQPWIAVGTVGTATPAAAVEQFDFSQGFGPLNWPRTGREVFDVVGRPDYWKVEDLDLFDGRGFVPGIAPANPLPDPDRRAQARFSQTITVTIRDLHSAQVIAAGFAGEVWRLGGNLEPGLDPGTYTVNPPLSPGSSYDAFVYSPAPTAAELARARADPALDGLAPYRSMLVPNPTGAEVHVFSSFPSAVDVGLQRTPYAPVYALARRLAARSPTPFAYVERVLALLGRGYIYDERPRPAAFPLVDFLLATHRGYCQQFAGAMALLLRMGGVPARVAGGFTTGTFDVATRRWVVADTDAHDWVEVWFPHWGWVRFDPTPAVAPARADTVAPAAAGGDEITARQALVAPRHRDVPAGAAVTGPGRRASVRAHGSDLAALLVGVGVVIAVAVVAAVALVVRRVRRRRETTILDRQIAELERALAISGRPAAPGVTLAELEHRFAASTPAAGYIRGLRLARYRDAPAAYDAAGRRALRAELGRGLGIAGRLRALWALPPRGRLGRSYTGR